MRSLIHKFIRVHWNTSLLFILLCCTGFLKAQPPAYMGPGIELVEKKGKWYYNFAYLYSLSHSQLPEPGKKGYQILLIHDHFTGQTVVPTLPGKSREDLLKVLVGPEGTDFDITLKVGRKEKSYTVNRKLYKDEATGSEYIFSSADELNYIRENFPYNFTAFNRPANRDKDSITDDLDACPDQYGSVARNGCPNDTDGDGIDDTKDKCITEYGPAESQGCLSKDSDGDGVLDEDDDCPYRHGLTPENSCPEDADCDDYDDNDGDEIPDEIDPCPDRWGSSYNRGCPGNVNTVFNSAYFWRDYTDLLVTLESNPSALSGDFAGNESGYRIYGLKNPLSQITTSDQYLLLDSSDYYSQLMVLYKSPDLRQAMDYFSSLCSEILNLEYDNDTSEFTAEHSGLSYEPDSPEEYFECTQYLIEDFGEGEVESTEIRIFNIRIEIYRYREGMKVMNEVRLWSEVY